MPYVSLHIHTKTTKLFGAPCVVITYFQNLKETGGIMRRWLRHRGVSHLFLATRSCSDEEHDENAHKYRYKAEFYEDWETLLKDERKYTEDVEWFAKLAVIQIRFPQFSKPPTAVTAPPAPATDMQISLFQ